jgi:hypothetical protein
MKRLFPKRIVVIGITTALAIMAGCEKLSVDNLPPEHGEGAEHGKPESHNTAPTPSEGHGVKEAPKPAAH